MLEHQQTVEQLALRWNLSEEMAQRRLIRESQSRKDNPPDMKAAALWYAKNGIPVFALHSPTAEGCSCGKNQGAVASEEVCRSVGKHPRTATGFKQATTDTDQVRDWWTQWPTANIGIPTGDVTKLLLVDLDPRNGGPTSSAELAERIGPIPDTVEISTGGGGRHLPFRYSGGRVRKELAKGIDLKGDGGYFVAPPSLHGSGRRYEFDESTGGRSGLLNPALAPQWLLDYAAVENKPKADRQIPEPTTRAQGEKVRPGERHKHLVSKAGTMQRRGMCKAAIEAALLAENRERCDPPKTDAEVCQIAESVSRYESGTIIAQPEGWPEIIPLASRTTDPLSVDCLPGWLGEMAQALAESTETPFEMSALLAMAVASACVAAKADVSPEPGYTEPLNLYTCPAMESGNRKTAVFNCLVAPLTEWERLESERVAPERQRILSERKTKEGRIERLRKKAASQESQSAAIREIQELENSLPEVPPFLRLFADDVTPERLASLMHEQGGSIAVLSDEGGIFDILGGRYSKGVPNLDLWLKGHSASPVRVDRQDRTRPPIIIDKPHLTVGISPQPDVLASLRDKPGFRGRGLLARFLYALPPSRLGYRSLTATTIPQDTEMRYRNGVRSLLSFRPDPMLHLRFTPIAYREWKEFQRGIEPQFREGGILEDMRDWGSKLPGACARMAGVFHLALYADRMQVPEEIEKPTVTAAIEAGTSLISHCRAAFALMDQDPETVRAERVLAWILRQRSSFFTVRDCFRSQQALFKRVTALIPTLTLLAQHGYLRIDRGGSSGGRPPSELCEVNPALLATLRAATE